MKGHIIVSPEKGRVCVKEYEVGEPGPREIQVRIHVSLISPGTERAWILNMECTPGVYPFEPGYCTAGIVEKTGSEVTRFKVGDRVACLLSHRSIGNIHEDSAAKIPPDVPFEHAVFLPLGQIALQGVRKARIELGEKVMVMGLGVIGQLAMQFARLNGALPAIGADLVESRINAALRCGAEEAVNCGENEWIACLRHKFQAVIESTGVPGVIPTALKIVEPGGRVVLLGSTRGMSTVDFYRDVHVKGVTVIGAHAIHTVPKHESRPSNWTWKDDSECFMSLLEKGKLCIDPLITDIICHEEIEKAYIELLRGNREIIGTIIKWI